MKSIEEDREYHRLYCAAYYRNNKEKISAKKRSPESRKKNRDAYSRNKLLWRNRWLKYKYGINNAVYDSMFASQSGLCAICLSPETRTSKWGTPDAFLKVDHCHKTKKVRALLCHKCNVAIGLFNHDIKIIKSAFEYLKLHV